MWLLKCRLSGVAVLQITPLKLNVVAKSRGKEGMGFQSTGLATSQAIFLLSSQCVWFVQRNGFGFGKWKD